MVKMYFALSVVLYRSTVELKAERDTHLAQPIIAVKRCQSSPVPSVKTSTSSLSTTPTTRHIYTHTHTPQARSTRRTDFEAVAGAQHTCVHPSPAVHSAHNTQSCKSTYTHSMCHLFHIPQHNDRLIRMRVHYLQSICQDRSVFRSELLLFFFFACIALIFFWMHLENVFFFFFALLFFLTNEIAKSEDAMPFVRNMWKKSICCFRDL